MCDLFPKQHQHNPPCATTPSSQLSSPNQASQLIPHFTITRIPTPHHTLTIQSPALTHILAFEFYFDPYTSLRKSFHQNYSFFNTLTQSSTTQALLHPKSLHLRQYTASTPAPPIITPCINRASNQTPSPTFTRSSTSHNPIHSCSFFTHNVCGTRIHLHHALIRTTTSSFHLLFYIPQDSSVLFILHAQCTQHNSPPC
jgi:hypothetical protein